MKKSELRTQIAEMRDDSEQVRQEILRLKAENNRLRRELEQMRQHWRPVPIVHEWQPKDPQCMFCDEPRASARHQVDGSA